MILGLEMSLPHIVLSIGGTSQIASVLNLAPSLFSFTSPLSNRREIVERTIGYMKEDVILSDRKRFDILINRTRLVVLQ